MGGRKFTLEVQGNAKVFLGIQVKKSDDSTIHLTQPQLIDSILMTEFHQPLQVQSHLEMPGILVQLGHIQRT